MQSASLATSMNVTYLAATGATGVADVQPYLNTLLHRRCDVVVAVGDKEVAAVAASAGANPAAHFVAVGSASAAPNVAAVDAAGGDVAAVVESKLLAANAGHFDQWASGSAR